MCQQCHNAHLDPTISRDKFLVDQLDQMSRAEKDLAIERLDPKLTSRLRMPPTLFKTITDDDRQAMIDELQEVAAPEVDRPRRDAARRGVPRRSGPRGPPIPGAAPSSVGASRPVPRVATQPRPW